MNLPDSVDIQTKSTTYSGTTWSTLRSQRCKIVPMNVSADADANLSAINADIPYNLFFRDRPVVKIGQRALKIKFSHPVIAVSTGDKKFTIDGDFTSEFNADDEIRIANSTGNDGTYTVVSATLSSGDTEIVVSETVSDATADGDLHVLEKYEIRDVKPMNGKQKAKAILRQ